jgi:RNA polymerase sigma-70 factor (ECF subfamily)
MQGSVEVGRRPQGVEDSDGDRREADSRAVRDAVERVRSGDMEALYFLYVRYSPNVLSFVRSLVNDHHEAEDITQNVFVKVATVIDKYEPREVPFAAWLLRVARNAALDHLRARRSIPCGDIYIQDDDLARVNHERRNDLKRALDLLPKVQREVLILRHVAGLSPVEIAEKLGKTENAVHGLHHRGRQSLQAALADLGAVPVVAPAQGA